VTVLHDVLWGGVRSHEAGWRTKGDTHTGQIVVDS
jgi:hypothetical protein